MMRNNNHIKPKATKVKLFIFISMLLCVFNSSIYAQTKTQSDTIGIKTDSGTLYLTPLEYAFMMHEETSWLVKANVGAGGRLGWLTSLNGAIEKRIAPSFTLDLHVEFGQYEILEGGGFVNGIQSSLETRWYYRLNKRVKNNKLARNMSDNYLSLGMAYTHIFENSGYYSFETGEKESYLLSLYAKWGLQRRFMKNGHADMGIKAGVGFTLKENNSSFLMFSTFVNLGLAFTKDRYTLDREKLCPVLKCYDGDNFIIKSNLSSLFSISLFKYDKTIFIEPHIAFERKIGSTAFSINTELLSFFHDRNRYSIPNQKNYHSRTWGSTLLFEGRWYYNLKHRIRVGKTGNGLSASYIAMGGSYGYSEQKNGRPKFTSSLHFAVGWQRLFSKHMYFDIQIASKYVIRTKDNDWVLYPKIALGYRF